MPQVAGYELEAQLYRSARTLVYRGRRKSDGLPVVLKVLAEEYPSFEDVSRFKREYEIGRRVSGDGAVVVLALEPVRSSWAIVMEDSGARTLRSLLAERRLPLEEALQLGIRLAASLAAVHRRNVIHKDINPSNILIEPARGQVRLIDFGLASLLPRESPSLLSPHTLEGTLLYISPEQTGRMNRAIDYRSDLYSLGVTLYELLTGTVPFASPNAVELVHLHIAQQPVPPHELEPSLPRPVSDVVMKLLAKMAEERYQSSLGLKSDLEACLGAWSAGARDVSLGALDLRPGQHDISHQFQLPQRLYGRESQLQELMQAFERATRGRAELVLVGGDSGVGKSLLVHELQRPVLDRRATFLSGKFDQLQRDVPYAPLLQALSDFVRRLMATNEETLGLWRQSLAAALGESGRVLTQVLPMLEQLLGPQPPVPELPSQEEQRRFHLVFQRFITALASEQHPLVLFLDDLQWADLPSLELLQLLMAEPRLQHLLLVCAWREREAPGVHPVRLMLQALETAGTRLTSIALSPLGPADVAQLVADTLRCDPEYSAPLAQLLWERSAGNPFFLGQLLRTLHEEGLIDFSPEEARWTWDLRAIRARGLTDNVIELMNRKLQRLPEATQQVLELAACLGNRFQLASLALVHEDTPAQTAARLYPAIEQGLILPLDERWQLVEHGGAADATYRFLHDRVQQAAYSRLPEAMRAEHHLRIARMLLARLAPKQLEEQLLELVLQLNRGSALVTEPQERYEVARLNLLAGRKARASAAFEPALRYFSMGRSLLPEAAWSERPSLCHDLHLEAMEAEYLNGHTEQGTVLSERLLARTPEPVDQVKIYTTRMNFASARGDLNGAIEDGYKALELLGLELPRSADLAVLMEAVDSVKGLMAGRSKQELLNLPRMTDRRWLAACQVAMALTSPLFGKDVLASLTLSLEMLKLCLRYGHSPEAPYFHADYALIHASILGDVDTATAHGELFLELFQRLGARRLESKVYVSNAAYILHWKSHLRETLEPLRRAIQAGLDTGDTEFAGYGVIHLALNLFYVGQPLDEVLPEQERYLELVKSRKLKVASPTIRSMRQLCLNLMGRSEDPRRLVGDSFDEEKEFAELQALGYGAGLAQLCLQKLLLALLFRDTPRALATAEQAESYVLAQLGEVSQVLHNFFQSLALLSAAGGAAEADRARLLATVETNQESLKRWAEQAPMNSLHRYHLVEAERARVRGDLPEAARLYEQAATGARSQGYLNEEALCHELAGEFFRAIGRHRLAHDSILEAATAYRRWGAEAKVADLERRYPEAFERQRALAEARRPLSSTSSSSGTGGDQLDLATVLQAASAISGEILLDRLLKRLMRSVIENAGAQRGLLLLPREGQWLIEAEQRVESTAPSRPCTPVEEGAPLATTLLHFVARTRESVVLDDASAEGLFTRDPYVLAHGLRSLLCMPLLNQGKLVAILYLENNHTVGAFTAGRLEVLRLLSAQAALSLHNALLYAQLEDYSHTLEQRVEERTRELQAKNQELGEAMRQLRTTQKQLVAQEKLASLGALTSGIAHELKNPLNFITNFAELSEEFTAELATGIASRCSPEGQEELGPMLSQLQQSVSKIQEHGQRASQIINGMLMHSRERPGPKAPADLNAVLAESINLGYRAFRAKTPGFELDLQTHYDPDVGEVDMAVPELSRVFINLIDNACYALLRKKSAAGERFLPRLEITTRSRGAHVEVRVRDNGTGIAADLLGKVFNPFFTTKPAGEGTGLGLSLSHDIIVGSHQGRLSVDSVEGEFTELLIELPRRPPAG